MAHDVFLSYTSVNKAVADMVCAALERRGIRVWIAPRDIRPGQEYALALMQAIEGARVLVAVVAKDYAASPHTMRELERAVSKGLTIMPVRVEDFLPEGALEYLLSGTHWLDAFTPPVEAQLERLADAILGLPGGGGERRGRRVPSGSNRRGRMIALACGVVGLVLAGVAVPWKRVLGNDTIFRSTGLPSEGERSAQAEPPPVRIRASWQDGPDRRAITDDTDLLDPRSDMQIELTAEERAMKGVDWHLVMLRGNGDIEVSEANLWWLEKMGVVPVGPAPSVTYWVVRVPQGAWDKVTRERVIADVRQALMVSLSGSAPVAQEQPDEIVAQMTLLAASAAMESTVGPRMPPGRQFTFATGSWDLVTGSGGRAGGAIDVEDEKKLRALGARLSTAIQAHLPTHGAVAGRTVRVRKL